MAATQKQEHVSLRLVLNQEKSQVLFAVAEKDFMDLLFSFFTLPLGTIARLITDKSKEPPVILGCISSLYESVDNLDERCLSTKTCKEFLLRPRNSAEGYCRNMKLNIDDTDPIVFFCCPSRCSKYCKINVSIFRNLPCKKCGRPMNCKINNNTEVAGGGGGGKGFMNSDATFIITNGLRIRPNLLGARLSLLKQCGIDDIHSVNYLTVNVTREKALDLLKCLLFSRTNLAEMFLNKSALPNIFPATLHCLSQLSPHAADTSIKYNVNLIWRKSNRKIVFAQGEEDFANFILSFLTFPLGGVLQMLEGSSSSSSSAGSVYGLYKSIGNLAENYFISKEAKNMLVNSHVAAQLHLKNQLLPECTCKSPFANHCGFVKGRPTMYLVSDDLSQLSVTGMSSVTDTSLLDNLDIPLSDLEVKVVSIGVKEGLSILKASLTSSSSALTNGLSHLFPAAKEEK